MDDKIIWGNWRATPFLASMAKKNEASMDDRELVMYIFFLDRTLKNANLDGVAMFCMVDPKTMIFNPYDYNVSKVTIREDPRGPPFAIIDFNGILRGWKFVSSKSSFYLYILPSKSMAPLTFESPVYGYVGFETL